MMKLCRFLFLVSFCYLIKSDIVSAQAACSTCTAVTTFTVNLTSNPNNTYTVTSNRNGRCCQGSGSDKCIRFNISLHSQATEVQFLVSTGNNGTWEIDCAAP